MPRHRMDWSCSISLLRCDESGLSRSPLTSFYCFLQCACRPSRPPACCPSRPCLMSSRPLRESAAATHLSPCESLPTDLVSLCLSLLAIMEFVTCTTVCKRWSTAALRRMAWPASQSTRWIWKHRLWFMDDASSTRVLNLSQSSEYRKASLANPNSIAPFKQASEIRWTQSTLDGSREIELVKQFTHASALHLHVLTQRQDVCSKFSPRSPPS